MLDADLFSYNQEKTYSVPLKTDCAHQESYDFNNIISNLYKGLMAKCCSQCDVKTELWMCLDCYTVGCSRYFNSHMLKHHESTNHQIVFGFEDLSFWCYACQSYIESPGLKSVANAWKERVSLAQSKED